MGLANSQADDMNANGESVGSSKVQSCIVGASMGEGAARIWSNSAAHSSPSLKSSAALTERHLKSPEEPAKPAGKVPEPRAAPSLQAETKTDTLLWCLSHDSTIEIHDALPGGLDGIKERMSALGHSSLTVSGPQNSSHDTIGDLDVIFEKKQEAVPDSADASGVEAVSNAGDSAGLMSTALSSSRNSATTFAKKKANTLPDVPVHAFGTQDSLNAMQGVRPEDGSSQFVGVAPHLAAVLKEKEGNRGNRNDGRFSGESGVTPTKPSVHATKSDESICVSEEDERSQPHARAEVRLGAGTTNGSIHSARMEQRGEGRLRAVEIGGLHIDNSNSIGAHEQELCGLTLNLDNTSPIPWIADSKSSSDSTFTAMHSPHALARSATLKEGGAQNRGGRSFSIPLPEVSTGKLVEKLPRAGSMDYPTPVMIGRGSRSISRRAWDPGYC